jgi:hypothetical protein
MNKVASVGYYLRLKTWSTCFLKILAVSERRLKTVPLGNMYTWHVSNM